MADYEFSGTADPYSATDKSLYSKRVPKQTYQEYAQERLNVEKMMSGKKIKQPKVKDKKAEDLARLKAYTENKRAALKAIRRPGTFEKEFTSARGQRRFRTVSGGVGALLRAFGAPTGALARAPAGSRAKQGRRYARPGRPLATYKYGMPIQDYKKLLAQRKALVRLQGQQQQEELYKKGYTPQQVQQIQYRKQVQEAVQQQGMPQKSYEQLLAEETVSPNTYAMMESIKAIQQKVKNDRLRMARILKERTMINRMTDIMKTPSIFGKDPLETFNPLSMDNNILSAPNIFKERPDNNIMRTGRFNIFQTREAGNNLNFF